MAQPEFPYTPRRGRLKGMTFETRQEYEDALHASSAGDGALDAPEGLDGPDRPPAPPEAPKTRARRGKVDKAMVVAILFPLNVGLWMIPATRADALDDTELDRLSDAIVKVAAVNQYVARAIQSGATSSAYVELAVVVGAIAVRRAARHGYLPSEIGAAVGGLMGFDDPPPSAEAPPPTNGAVEQPAAPFAAPYAEVPASGPVVGSPGIPDLGVLSRS